MYKICIIINIYNMASMGNSYILNTFSLHLHFRMQHRLPVGNQ